MAGIFSAIKIYLQKLIFNREYIKRIAADYFRNKPVKKVYLFGSYARGEADESSDVDLFIELDENNKPDYFQLAGMWEEVQNEMKKNVDLVHKYRFLKQRFEEYINNDKILLFEK
jgi:uncharacterized protein